MSSKFKIMILVIFCSVALLLQIGVFGGDITKESIDVAKLSKDMSPISNVLNGVQKKENLIETGSKTLNKKEVFDNCRLPKSTHVSIEVKSAPNVFGLSPGGLDLSQRLGLIKTCDLWIESVEKELNGKKLLFIS